MILVWVTSLLLLGSSLLVCLERFTALRIVEVNTIAMAQQDFMESEKSVLACEKNLSNLSTLSENTCFIQSISKNHWLITSKSKPAIQVHVALDEKTGIATRLNWRQVFE